MTYRCWQDWNESEPDASRTRSHFEADSPEEAAEKYAESLEDIGDLGHMFSVNVSAPNGAERIYWTVEVVIDWDPSFHARPAVKREDAP